MTSAAPTQSYSTTPDASCDVVVYGGTAGGVTAAVAAASEGMKVALVEPGHHVGGMVSGGLGYSDLGQRDVIGGYALTFYEAVAEHYRAPLWGWVGPEPHVAEEIFLRWLEQAGVEVHFGQRLEAAGKQGAHLQRVTTRTGQSFEAAAFIDASYEGDLIARAGVPYAVGREGRQKYGESWAGRQPLRPGKHNFDVFISPFTDESESELLPLIHARPPAEIGQGDGAIQGYGFRVCLTRNPHNQRPFPEPENYDPAQFELLRRYLEAKGETLQAGQLMGLIPNLPGDKCDVNSIGPLSTNLLDGSNWAYPEADDETRQSIWRRHLHYTQSFFYFLTQHDSVPPHIQHELRQWSLCQDEFTDTGGWPHQLYIREARRMLGEYVMTQHDLTERRRKYDTVGLGSYHIDVRHTQRIWDYLHLHPRLVPAVFNEGYLSVPVEPYEIPYRALLPPYHQCENLLVPVCLSASHVAFASVRMEPQYMVLGHSAGVAAALAIRQNIPVHRVDIGTLQTCLQQARQVMSLGQLRRA